MGVGEGVGAGLEQSKLQNKHQSNSNTAGGGRFNAGAGASQVQVDYDPYSGLSDVSGLDISVNSGREAQSEAAFNQLFAPTHPSDEAEPEGISAFNELFGSR